MRDHSGTLIGFSKVTVDLTYGARQALERARTESPDVFLLDIGLPDVNGNELAKLVGLLAGVA